MKARSPTGWSLLGKHPGRADFARLNASTDAAQELHRFLEAGVELLHRQRQPPVVPPTRFLFTPRTATAVLTGVMQASVDSVGRQFPLAVYLELPPAELPGAWAELPFYAEDGLEAAAELLAGSAANAKALEAGVQALSLPGPEAAQLARARADQALALVTVEDLQGLFAGSPGAGGAWYAVNAVLAGCEARRKGSGEAPTLECPLSPGFGATAWLAIADRGNPGPLLPSLAWTASRLYLGLGPLPPAIFPGLVGGAMSSHRIWPTSTAQQAAIDSARLALKGAPLLGSPTASLVEALAGVGGRR